MPNVGYATIQIIPSVRGISDELRRQLSGPASDAGDSAGQESGRRFGDSWKAGLAVAGAAAGAVLAAATVSAVEKEKVADRLSAQLGLSGKGAKQAGKVAGSLYSKAVVESFEDGAAAVRAVMGSGLIPEKATTKSIEAITTKVADLASTFDQDLTGTANAAAQMIRTGLAKDGAAALDLLTAGFQSSANKADDFVDTVNEYGTQFRKAGLDGATAIGLLNQAIRAGARDADIAADAIKEFSIRAVDGSTTSADGFKALGLNADSMAKRFAQGGTAANAVLQLTLDRLRGITDPVKQGQAAVALFGTQAEDLGQALLAMDPSTAAAGLGKVGDAAKRVGDTIRGNTSTELAVLQRQLMSGVGVVVQAVILPGLRGLISVLTVVGSVIGSVVGWFREWGAWLLPVAVLIGGLTIALNAQAIATALVTAVFSVYRAAILAGTAVTQGFAVAQALLNSVMALNPITLIVIALVALATALVVAYRKSETFRAIVQAAWQGIQTVAMWAWNNVLKPAFDGIVAALKVVGQWATWLWQNVLSPVFGFIGAAARILVTAVVTLALLPIIAVFKLVAAVASWLWSTILKPVFGLIGALAMWLWNNALKPAFDKAVVVFKAVGIIAQWLWLTVIRPVFNAIAAKVSEWWGKTKVIFDVVMAYIRGPLADRFKWLWNNVIKPVWDGIKATISWVWENGIKPVFEALKSAVGTVRDSFKAGVDGIGRIWDGLKSIARKPVQFIVDTVYNNGIRKIWNTVADFTGAPKLNPVKFARGGRTHGGVPGRDSIPALLMADEYVVKRDSARQIGFGNLEYMNRTGQMPVQRFADGGIVEWLSGAAKKIGSAVLTGAEFLSSPGKAWDAATSFIRTKAREGLSGSQWAQALAQFPLKMLKSLKDKVVSFAKGMFGGGSAQGSVASALGFARSQAGKPYQWGGAGNPSWDCSGFMSGIQKVIQGLSPNGRLWSTFSFQGDQAPPGWKRNLRSPFMIGITNKGVGHTAGTLAGVNVESRGGDGVVVGSKARGYNSSLFEARYGFAPALKQYDAGGWLTPGVTTAVNASGRPEAILTAPQWRAVESLAARGASLDGQRLRLVVRDREFDAYVEEVADGRVEATLRPLTTTVRAKRRG